MKVLFDFDGTLRSYDGKDILPIHDKLQKHLSDGDEVSILTSRDPNTKHVGLNGEGVKKYVNEHFGNIPVYFTPDKEKWEWLEGKDYDLIYDDDPNENKEILENTDVKVKYVDLDKSKERAEKLGLLPVKKTNLKDKSCIVFDHGGYMEVARSLSKDFGKVYYYTPWEQGFPKSNDTIIGSGFDEFERINHFFDYVDKVDLFVFCDIYHADLQEYLVKQGKRVWGARGGDQLEISRYELFEHLDLIGLPIPKTELVVGIDNLRRALKKVENKFIKLDSFMRGEVETFHHIDYDITEPILDKLEYNVGARKNDIRFIIQDPIPCKAEIGYDGYSIDGDFPDTCLVGIEVKDCAYCGKVMPYDEINEHIRFVNDKLSHTLKAYQYRAFFSTEIRVGEDDKPYLIDVTMRFPAPPTAVLLELIDNLGEIMYDGAGGKMVQPVFKAKFGAEVIGLSSFAKEGNFTQVFFTDEIKDFVKMPYSCVVDKKTYIVPQVFENERVCEVVAIGDTIEGCIEDLEERCRMIKGHTLKLDCSVLNGSVEELKKL